jgi:hypothetical protein
LIQNRAQADSIDSKTHSPRFDYFKFEFHSICSVTFATISAALSGHVTMSDLSPLSGANEDIEQTSPNVRAVKEAFEQTAAH